MNTFQRDEYEHTAKMLRSDSEQIVRAVLSNNYNIILAALEHAAACCHSELAQELRFWGGNGETESQACMLRAAEYVEAMTATTGLQGHRTGGVETAAVSEAETEE